MTKTQLAAQSLIDSMAPSVLVFDSADRLVLTNESAKALFGADLRLIQAEGWGAAQVLFNAKQVAHARKIDEIRKGVLTSGEAARFTIYRGGERLPGWISTFSEGGDKLTMVAVDKPDWSALNDLMSKYLDEVREVMHATQGHTNIIVQSISRARAGTTAEQIAPRVTGFARLIDIHMFRLRALTDMVERLERIRTGAVRDLAARGKKRISFADYMEDFVEALDESQLVDPENDPGDYRKRIQAIIPPKLMLSASTEHLTVVLHDILRNAIMYSMRATPIKVIAYANRDGSGQIDIVDEGYGVRTEEVERVFSPFMRSRQPQIMGEFGYGLSLYLCKYEIEAMNGRIWFASEEGVGTTFSIKLPLWQDATRETRESSPQ
ncbi:MAG: ATP-binding protein [Chloroflexota bacterium]|nr:ATP-binding protein [Chloroflexota bacterium]